MAMAITSNFRHSDREMISAISGSARTHGKLPVAPRRRQQQAAVLGHDADPRERQIADPLAHVTQAAVVCRPDGEEQLVVLAARRSPRR